MSRDHNTKSNGDERLLNAELLADHWQGRYYAVEGQREKYKELMDATAKDADKAHALLRQALAALEAVLSDDQPYIQQSKDAVIAIKEFLK